MELTGRPRAAPARSSSSRTSSSRARRCRSWPTCSSRPRRPASASRRPTSRSGRGVAVPATVAQPGAITLRPKLVELVRELPLSRSRSRCSRTAGSRSRAGPPRFSLVGLPADEYPPLETGDADGHPGSRWTRAPPRHGGPDQLRHVAGREPAVPERAHLLVARRASSGWSRPTAIGSRSRAERRWRRTWRWRASCRARRSSS